MTTTIPLFRGAFARRAVLTLGLASAAVLLNACGISEAQEQAAETPATPVQVAAVPVRTISDWRDFTGEIEAQERVDVRPRVSGYIQQVAFSEGALVKKGQLLFQIDPSPFAAQVERLRADLERAQADAALAASRKQRAVALLAENAISQEEADQLVASAAGSSAALASARAALKAAELDLSWTRVTAPIDGRVSRALITAGNLVDGGKVLTTLVSVDPVYVSFDVDEATYLDALGQGDGARVFAGRMTDEGTPHEAKLDFVDNVSRDGVVRLRATLDNSTGNFTPGLFARVRLVAGQRYEAALVDDKAIGTDLNKKFVLVVTPANVAEYRGVEIGSRLDGLRVIRSGLKAGDVIVVNGLQHVKPGSAVAPTLVAMGGEGAASAELVGSVGTEEPGPSTLRSLDTLGTSGERGEVDGSAGKSVNTSMTEGNPHGTGSVRTDSAERSSTGKERTDSEGSARQDRRQLSVRAPQARPEAVALQVAQADLEELSTPLGRLPKTVSPVAGAADSATRGPSPQPLSRGERGSNTDERSGK